MSDLKQRVQQTIDALVASGAERGIQVAAYDGRDLVVDAVAGEADHTTGRPVTAATPFYNWSIGKGMTATCAHVCVEQGAFDYDTRVADVWPEFAAHGKQDVTVRHVLTHTAGVPGLPPTSTIEDVCDWAAMTHALEEQEPWWEPGTTMGYHAYTFGYLVGEVIRRATGRRISEVLATDVAAPLGMTGELWFGTPPDQQAAFAVLEDASRDPDAPDWTEGMPDDLPMFRASPLAVFPTAEMGNRTDVLAADIPAGGKVSARAIATMYASLLGNTGTALMTPERASQVTAPAYSGEDTVFGGDSSWALGYAIGMPGAWESSTAFGMAGAGGSWAGADSATGLVLAVTKNVMSDDFATVEAVAKVVLGSE